MRLEFQSAIALSQHGRRTYGTAHWIEGRKIAFSTYGAVSVGDRLEMMLELTGAYDSIWAEVVLVETTPSGVGGPLECVGDIAYIPDEDEDKLARWIDERSVSHLSHRGGLSSQVSHVGELSLSTARRTAAKRGRESIRMALRGSLKRAETAHPTSWAALELSRDGSTLSVTWGTWQGLAEDWNWQLSRGRLRVDTTKTCPPQGYGLTVRLCLPDGQILAIQAEVVSTDSTGMVLALTIPPTVLRQLNPATRSA